jgi:hypothetical protein
MATMNIFVLPRACPMVISAKRLKETSMLAEHAQSTYYTERHGGPYDRGQADSYYGREYNPHYFVGDSYNSPKIELAQMTAHELVAYTAGYRDNEANGNKKDWS